MGLSTAPRTTTRDVWAIYRTMFEDDLEAAGKSENTRRTYCIAVDQLGIFLKDRGMPHDPTTVTREHLTEWMRYLQRPKDEGGQGLTKQTALQRYRSVSRLFAFLVRTDEIKESPMAKMRAPDPTEKQPPIISEPDLAKLMKAVTKDDFESRRDKAIIGLFIDCGMRIGEMAGIKLDDLKIDDRRVTITGKGSRSRTVAFVRETRKDILRYLLKRDKRDDADLPWLWLGKRGQLTASGIYRMVQRRCKDARIPRINPHRFRHSMAHMYLMGGGSEGDLMKVTGWTSRAMVDRYGASAAAERAAEAHDRFSPRKRL